MGPRPRPRSPISQFRKKSGRNGDRWNRWRKSRMPSSGSRPPAYAGRTCGPTAASTPSPDRRRWGTSTAVSSKRLAARSPPSGPDSSSLARSSPPTISVPTVEPATILPASTLGQLATHGEARVVVTLAERRGFRVAPSGIQPILQTVFEIIVIPKQTRPEKCSTR